MPRKVHCIGATHSWRAAAERRLPLSSPLTRERLLPRLSSPRARPFPQDRAHPIGKFYNRYFAALDQYGHGFHDKHLRRCRARSKSERTRCPVIFRAMT